ncbi:MAG: hypothetical protein IH948_00730 [Bacteroidetes bacterium]|nr:hypothetical protein [Bacteroidota bacterium]
MNDIQKLKDIQDRAKEDFSYFIKYVFPLSFRKGQIVKAPHTWDWAKRIQTNKRTATLSARKHLKSTTIYAYIMWIIFRLEEKENVKWLYMSYNQKMSVYHTENIKNLIRSNPYFSGIKDSTSALSMLDYTWGNNRFQCTPSGILTFNRGWHGEGVICDDILQDPTSELNFTIIDKINRIFMEQVMSLPKEGGRIHLVGTAQHQTDLFFQLKENPSWDWAEHKAILNEKEEKPLWPELFSYERLCEIRRDEIGEKAFKKEYMCSPVWTEEAFFQRDELMEVVNVKTERVAASVWKRGGYVFAGLDIGKKAHPSHVSIFWRYQNHTTMLYQEFMWGWDYTKQIEHMEWLTKLYLIDEIRYDDTRGELESFREQNLIDKRLWVPFNFSRDTKFKIAGNFSKMVNNKEVSLINNQKMIDSVLSVNNDLQAPQTSEGHGDAFWSIALGLYERPVGGGYISI